MKDKKCRPTEYRKVKAFLQGTWVQVPDRTVDSRIMRPIFERRSDAENDTIGMLGRFGDEQEQVRSQYSSEEEFGRKNNVEPEDENQIMGWENLEPAEESQSTEEQREGAGKVAAKEVASTFSIRGSQVSKEKDRQFPSVEAIYVSLSNRARHRM